MGYRKRYSPGSLKVIQFENIHGKKKWGVAYGSILVSAIAGYDSKKFATEVKNRYYKEKIYVFTPGRKKEKNGDFNGMSNLAVQLIAHLNQGISNFHLEPPGTRDCWEEYIYTITDKNGKPHLTCFDVDKQKNVPIPGERI